MVGKIELASFEFTIPGIVELADELGVWQSTYSGVSAEDLAPNMAQPSRIQASVWHVNLPVEPQVANIALQTQIAQLERAEQALPDAFRRLKNFVRQNLAWRSESFSTGLHGRLYKPEQELALLVSVANMEVSFGIFDNLPKSWKDITQQATAFFDRIRTLLLHFAWIESFSGGSRLGLTTVSWNGHFQTVWGHNSGTIGVEQHISTLNLALRTRSAWLRMALLITYGGLRLSALFPTNPFLAIPATWQFIKQVLELSRELDQPSLS